MQTEEYRRLFEHEDRYWWFVGRRRLAARLLRQESGAGDVLDLGCGTGALLAELVDSVATGVDRFPEALAFCQERGLTRLVRGVGERLPCRDGTFDAIVGLDVLEHIEDDAAALAECLRVLRPGGTLVLSVPAFRWLWGPHDVALMHFRRYSRAGLVARLREAGFDVRRATYSVFALFPLVVLFRVWDRASRRGPEVRLPRVPAWLNALLVRLLECEAAWLSRRGLPWGSSVVALARKPVQSVKSPR